MLAEPGVGVLWSCDVESEGKACVYCGDDGSWELDTAIPGGGRTLPDAVVDGEASGKIDIWTICCLRGEGCTNDSGASMVSSLNTLASVSWPSWIPRIFFFRRKNRAKSAAPITIRLPMVTQTAMIIVLCFDFSDSALAFALAAEISVELPARETRPTQETSVDPMVLTSTVVLPN